MIRPMEGDPRISDSLTDAISSIFGEGVRVAARVPVPGGDINRAYALTLTDGTRVFMKTNRKQNLGFFTAEAAGLRAIRQTGAIRAPEVFALGTDGDEAFALMTWISSGSRSAASSAALGQALARMHAADTAQLLQGGRFGFPADNYIGASVQRNSGTRSWTEFFLRCRLAPQFARAASYFDTEERRRIDGFLHRVPGYLAEPEKPSLLHGDLWAGNYMIDASGHPWLVDPAVYVGHAEADLAMTELFGGFDSAFYDAYAAEAGIDPDYPDRRDIYNLYHLLNHLNLFGAGYLRQVTAIVRRYA